MRTNSLMGALGCLAFLTVVGCTGGAGAPQGGLIRATQGAGKDDGGAQLVLGAPFSRDTPPSGLIVTCDSALGCDLLVNGGISRWESAAGGALDPGTEYLGLLATPSESYGGVSDRMTPGLWQACAYAYRIPRGETGLFVSPTVRDADRLDELGIDWLRVQLVTWWGEIGSLDPRDKQVSECPAPTYRDVCAQPGRTYASRDLERCYRADLLCATGTRAFTDQCGCGCVTE